MLPKIRPDWYSLTNRTRLFSSNGTPVHAKSLKTLLMLRHTRSPSFPDSVIHGPRIQGFEWLHPKFPGFSVPSPEMTELGIPGPFSGSVHACLCHLLWKDYWIYPSRWSGFSCKYSSNRHNVSSYFVKSFRLFGSNILKYPFAYTYSW